MNEDMLSMDGGAVQVPMQATPPAPPAPAAEPAEKPDAAEDRKNRKIARKLFTRIEASKTELKTFLPQWQKNVEQRLGIPSATDEGVDTGVTIQTELNPDWSLTKTKTANLYSQVPTVQGTHENNKYAAAVAPFMKSINYEIGPKRAHISVAMKECLNDVVNCSGFAGMMVGWAARFQDRKVPAIDTSMIPPDQLQQLLAAGQIPMESVPQMTDSRFFCTRISPKDLLKPKEFVGSDFDDAAWIGCKGRKSWSEAKAEWKLKEEDKAGFISGKQNASEQLKVQTDDAEDVVEDSGEYEEIYYWRYLVDPDEPSFCAIWKLVRVAGRDEPVVHEPWRGQKMLEDGRYVGSKKFPIRILTLTYVSDNAIPPSDTEAGAPQVHDLRLSRRQMFQNRKHSTPMRWYNVNSGIDPLTIEQIRQGEFQGLIPVNGQGDRMIGEVARASYPSEDLTFDRNTKGDLAETWRLGANQTGAMSYGDHTKAETNVVQQNFATGIGEERGQVASFFLGAVEVLAGWMCLYSDFPVLTDEQRTAMEQAWDNKTILHDLVLNILPDSTIVLDVNQQLDRISKFANQWGKSGYVNVKPLAIKAAELSGIDPTEVVVDPQPPKKDDPNISYRFTGKDDLMNPMVVAMLLKSGELPDASMIQQAVKLLKLVNQLAAAPEAAPNPAGPEGVPPPTPDGPQGPKPMDPAAPDAHPEWTLMSTVAKRQRDI